MSPWINNVTYGNPVDEFLPYLKNGAYQSIYEQLKEYPFPPNDSEATQDELRELIAYQNMPEQQDEKIIARYMGYNDDVVGIFKKYVTSKIGENLDSEIDEVIEDSKFVLLKLKFFYQRPRPYQVAQYYKAKLFPFKSMTAISPSYPSGHVFQARLLTELIGNKFPEHYEFLKNLTHDISVSRMFLGLHFPSDNDFAVYCVKTLTKSKEFTTKYGI
jgi:hypothetical protein